LDDLRRYHRDFEMTYETLKPCPFCGGHAEIVHIDDGENKGGSCVCCTSCLASGNVEFEFKENFISNWNRRSTDTTKIDRLKAAFRNVDASDWTHICSMLPDTGQGKFWRAVLYEARTALEASK